jgi:hypothetical protein
MGVRMPPPRPLPLLCQHLPGAEVDDCPLLQNVACLGSDAHAQTCGMV